MSPSFLSSPPSGKNTVELMATTVVWANGIITKCSRSIISFLGGGGGGVVGGGNYQRMAEMPAPLSASTRLPLSDGKHKRSGGLVTENLSRIGSNWRRGGQWWWVAFWRPVYCSIGRLKNIYTNVGVCIFTGQWPRRYGGTWKNSVAELPTGVIQTQQHQSIRGVIYRWI